MWEWLRQELLIAIGVAASLTVVLVVRRWATELLGQGVLNADVFSGNAAIAELAARVEQRVRPQGGLHEPAFATPGARPASGATRTTNGGSDDDDGTP